MFEKPLEWEVDKNKTDKKEGSQGTKKPLEWIKTAKGIDREATNSIEISNINNQAYKDMIEGLVKKYGDSIMLSTVVSATMMSHNSDDIYNEYTWDYKTIVDKLSNFDWKIFCLSEITNTYLRSEHKSDYTWNEKYKEIENNDTITSLFEMEGNKYGRWTNLTIPIYIDDKDEIAPQIIREILMHNGKFNIQGGTKNEIWRNSNSETEMMESSSVILKDMILWNIKINRSEKNPKVAELSFTVYN